MTTRRVTEPRPQARREFLTAAALGLGAAAIGLRPGAAWGAAALSPIGLQLYTVRRAMRQSVEETLAAVARIGYREVEFAGYFGRSPVQIRDALAANGLSAPSAHSADLGAIRTSWAKTLDEAAAIGHRTVICAWLPDEVRTADGYRLVAAEFNRAGEAARQVGLDFAYHNHSYEFSPSGNTIGYDILLAESDPKLVSMQMDLFWIVKGGRDPLVYFERHPGRFSSVHVKDMDANGAMVDVGAGRLPFAQYFARAAQAGIRHYFVEHDEPGDPMASARASLEYLKRL
jgi:sugar phosphate isomerase/epimerase